MNCIHQRNPFGGFNRSHTIWCLYCEEPAVVHFNVVHTCGNVCEKCARKFRRDQVEEGIYVRSDQE